MASTAMPRHPPLPLPVETDKQTIVAVRTNPTRLIEFHGLQMTPPDRGLVSISSDFLNLPFMRETRKNIGRVPQPWNIYI
jgi:hypothetical protein